MPVEVVLPHGAMRDARHTQVHHRSDVGFATAVGHAIGAQTGEQRRDRAQTLEPDRRPRDVRGVAPRHVDPELEADRPFGAPVGLDRRDVTRDVATQRVGIGAAAVLLVHPLATAHRASRAQPETLHQPQGLHGEHAAGTVVLRPLTHVPHSPLRGAPRPRVAHPHLVALRHVIHPARRELQRRHPAHSGVGTGEIPLRVEPLDGRSGAAART